MDEFLQLLDRRLAGRVAFVGMGNPDFGDDAAGLHLAARLARALPPPHAVFHAGTTPERCVRTLREERFATVVLLDAADFGASPGAVAWFDSPEFQTRFPTVSTHRLPLALLARLIAEGSDCRISLLGVQPASLKSGAGLSPEVASAVEALGTLVLDRLLNRASPPVPDRRNSVARTQTPREVTCR